MSKNIDLEKVVHEAMKTSKKPHDFEMRLLESSKNIYPEYYTEVFSILIKILSKDCDDYDITMRESAIRLYGLPRRGDVIDVKIEESTDVEEVEEEYERDDDIGEEAKEESEGKDELHITDLSGTPLDELPKDLRMKIENIMVAKKHIPTLNLEEMEVEKEVEDRLIWMKKGKPMSEIYKDIDEDKRKKKKKKKKKKKIKKRGKKSA